eukprot:m.122133 g.122133  ORF g.122133 m.122133 type:complete len:233 (+) comp28902_c0_seq1:158-856(+)
MAFLSVRVLTLLLLTSSSSSAVKSNVQAPDQCATLGPCKNGICVDKQSTLSAYTCECFLGWAGVDCEVPALISPVFSSNMVLQRFQPADATTGRAAISPVIFGADNSTLPGDSISLTLMNGNDMVGPLTTMANVNGSWSASVERVHNTTYNPRHKQQNVQRDHVEKHPCRRCLRVQRTIQHGTRGRIWISPFHSGGCGDASKISVDSTPQQRTLLAANSFATWRNCSRSAKG